MPLPESRIRALWWIVAAAFAAWLMGALAPVLMPFFLAAILGYVCQPLVLRLVRRGVPRALAVLIVMLLQFVLIALVLLTVLPLFAREFSLLAQQLPAFLDWLNRALAPWVAATTGVSVSLDAASLKATFAGAIHGSQGLGMKLAESVRLGGLGLLGLAVNAVLVPVVQFYLMRDWEEILGRAERLVPRRWHAQTMQFFREADDALGQYLHGQVLVILVMSVFYTAGLWMTGLSFFLPVGIITGVLVIVPYIGAATGIVLGSLAALMQFQEWTGVIWVWVVFALGQALEGNFITPKLVGERIGLHPVAVIFALLAFGQLFGFAGLLLALPASAVLLVGLRKLRQAWVESSLYRDER